MTITPAATRKRLIEASAITAGLSVRLPDAVTNARIAALDPKSNTNRPEGEDAGIRSKGSHSDPTGDTAINTIGYDERVFELFEANMDTLRVCLANLTQFAEQWAAPPVVEVRRCGVFTSRDVKLEEWYTSPNARGRVPQECNNPAWSDRLADGATSWRPHGLCVSCYSLRRDWLRRRDHGAAA